jgi:hypothetical protein
MEEQIKQRAYEMWEADGRPEGQDQTYWFKAISEAAATAAASIKPAARKRTQRRKAA